VSDAEEKVLRGSCLCGEIAYEIRGKVFRISHCHCSMCRKAHGAAFATYATVAWEDFVLLSGEPHLRRYSSSDQVTRTFCDRCGSTLQFMREGRPRFGIAAGTLDSDPGVRPSVQIFAQDKAPWWDLHEPPPSFDAYPPSEESQE